MQIAPVAPGVVTSLSPFKVRVLGVDQVGQSCDRVAPAAVGQRGGVLVVNGQRVWLGAYDKDDSDISGLVPWTVPGRRIGIGPTGDFQPTYELYRQRPSALHGSQHYLSAATTPELAWTVEENGVILATLRFTKDGLRHQDPSAGSRYFAYRDELPTDTGWLSLTLASGFTGTCFYRVKNGFVSFKGRITRTAGAWPNSYTTVATLPAAAQCPDLIYSVGKSRYSPLGYALSNTLQITSDGATNPGAEFELRSISPFTP